MEIGRSDRGGTLLKSNKRERVTSPWFLESTASAFSIHEDSMLNEEKKAILSLPLETAYLFDICVLAPK